jgi:hypothetical protein
MTVALKDHPLKQAFARTVSAGLTRKSINTCSRWAEHYRVMGMPFPGPWTFNHHPWLREMHDCTAELMVGMKAAQMGYTETALNKVFFAIDIRGKSCLYVLPASTPDATDFSSSRFDPALELSPHLTDMFSHVKNVGHKRAGSANLYIRGSRSRSQLKSVPASEVILDELDEMVQDNIEMIGERMSGQLEKQMFYLSTPTLAGFGIDAHFELSSQRHYIFQCVCCNRLTELVFPDCLVITAEHEADPKIKDSHIICKDCKGVLPHETKIEWLKERGHDGNARWEPSYSDRLYEGYHINQLYSMTVRPFEIAQKVIKAESDPATEQELYNSKMGLTHEVTGARVSESELTACIGESVRRTTGRSGFFMTMGVDVGTHLHVEIDEWHFKKGGYGIDVNLLGTPRVVTMLKVKEFEELDLLMRDFGIHYCVIDANPERRKAREFAQRFYGRVRQCFYGKGVTGKVIKDRPEEMEITVDRTSWLDLSLGRYRTKSISIPKDTTIEYKDHMKALVRIYTKDSDGNPIARYEKAAKDQDHYAHARNYAEMALPLGLKFAQNQDIKGIV